MNFINITTQDEIDDLIYALNKIIGNKKDPTILKDVAKFAKKEISKAWKSIESLEQCCYNCGNPFRTHGMYYNRYLKKPKWERDEFVRKDSKEISCHCHPDAYDHAYQSKNGLKTVCENWRPLRKNFNVDCNKRKKK